RYMFKKISSGLLITIITFTLACTATPRIDKQVEGSNNLRPEPQHGVIAKEIADLLTSYTYKKVSLNDSISNLIYDRYIKNLDPNRIYFLASDIAEFESFRYQFGPDLKSEDLSYLFYIFNVYQKRYNVSINYTANSLAKTKFDFTKKEEYVFSREKMDYFKNASERDKYWTSKVKYDFLNLKLAKTGSSAKDSVKKSDEEIANEIKETLKKRYENLISQASKI